MRGMRAAATCSTWVHFCSVIVLGAAAVGCAGMRAPTTPMPYVYWAPATSPATSAIVMLPGFGDRDSVFMAQGMVAIVRQLVPGAALFAADAHYGYYRSHSLRQRLHADVMKKVIARHGPVWLVGTSMGGLGAMLYARSKPQNVRGLILLAPYLGPSGIADPIRAAGGLCKWRAGPAPDTAAARAFHLNWRWLQRQACEPGGLPIYIGWGASDRLRRANRLLGDALPAARRGTLPGGHGWKVWRPLLRRLGPRAWPRSPAAMDHSGGGGSAPRRRAR